MLYSVGVTSMKMYESGITIYSYVMVHFVLGLYDVCSPSDFVTFTDKLCTKI